jgi:hypothetical protein
LGTN